jgi:hypothetical protein
MVLHNGRRKRPHPAPLHSRPYAINDCYGFWYSTKGGASAPTQLHSAPAPTRLLIQLTGRYSLLHW